MKSYPSWTCLYVWVLLVVQRTFRQWVRKTFQTPPPLTKKYVYMENFSVSIVSLFYLQAILPTLQENHGSFNLVEIRIKRLQQENNNNLRRLLLLMTFNFTAAYNVFAWRICHLNGFHSEQIIPNLGIERIWGVLTLGNRFEKKVKFKY